MASVPTSKGRLAVLDDDESVLRAVARLLRCNGYQVSTFESSQAFLDSLASSIPQCLILDVHMPGMSGFEVHARLNDLGYRLPVVYVTAHEAPQIDILGCPEGTIGLLLKPLRHNELLWIVDQCLGYVPTCTGTTLVGDAGSLPRTRQRSSRPGT